MSEEIRVVHMSTGSPKSSTLGELIAGVRKKQAQLDKVYLTWEDVHEATRHLAGMIRDKYDVSKFKGIIGVARGGWISATILAHELDIKNLRSISLSSYESDDKRGEIRINEIFEDGDNWLLVDDLVDSGETFKKIREYLPNCTYVTMIAKPDGKSTVDVYACNSSQNCWIDFPWEVPS